MVTELLLGSENNKQQTEYTPKTVSNIVALVSPTSFTAKH